MREIHLIHDTCVTPPGWRVEGIDGRPRGEQSREPTPDAMIAAKGNGLIQAC
jgi:hypothetical protein